MNYDESLDQISLFTVIPEPPPAAAPQLPPTPSPAKKTVKRPAARKTTTVAPAAPPKPAKSLSGLVPSGDVRLTANIREDLHLRLKIVAAKRRTTIGELIEEFVEKYLKD